jgi:hypothetical protein
LSDQIEPGFGSAVAGIPPAAPRSRWIPQGCTCYGNAEIGVIETVNVNYADVTARQRRLDDLPEGINHHDRHLG